MDPASFLIGYAAGILTLTALLLVMLKIQGNNRKEEYEEPWPW